MIYKKIMWIALLTISAKTTGITLGPNLLANSPAGYLADLQHDINDFESTKQIGTELFMRDYITTVSVYDQVDADFDAKPLVPGSGYTFNDGRWIWIADSVGAQTGVWIWILQTTSYFINYITSLIIPF